MTDIASLALGVLVEVNHAAQAIYQTWQAARHFGGDSATLHTRFSASSTNLKAYERVLFDNGRFTSVKGRLFDHLPNDVCQTLVEMLFDLHTVLNRYVVVTKTYSPRAETDEPTELDPPMSEKERTQAVLALGLSRAEQQARSVSWMRKTWWAMWDKRNVEKLVLDFERWIKRVRLLVESAWWPLPFFATIPHLDSLRADMYAREAGLTDDIELRQLIIVHPDNLTYIRTLEVAKKEFNRTEDIQDTSFGLLNGQNVVVEYQDYETDEETNSMNEQISTRIMRLVALMHESNDARFKVMTCTHYIDDKFEKRFGFVFTLPPPLNAPPDTLLNYLSCPSSSRPDLTARVKLAYTLAETIQLLPSVGWVHKSLRSEKILFLRSAAPKGDSPEAIAQAKMQIPDLDNPRVFGFEFSRLESDSTSLRPDLEIRRNIYRHPDRWGHPKQAFGKIHDIYAFGVMLLEIGLWESIKDLDKGKLLSEIYPNATDTKRVLLKHAKKRLGFCAGQRYQQIVLKCLDGGFEGIENDDAMGSKLQLRFMKEVVDALQDVSEHL